MSRKLRVGIAGYGVVGRRRSKCIEEHPDMEVVAVCDRNFDDEGELEHGIRYYSDYSRLFQEDLDVAFVCMTNDVAAEVTIAALSRGFHVFCEKPPGRNVEDILRVVACEREHPGLKLKYGFNHRYHDSVRDALRIIESKELGSLVNIRGVYGKSKIIGYTDWRTKRELAGGGILLDQGIHMVDMIRLFAGDFSEIHSFISNGFWNHDVEDNAYALMRSPDGVVAFLHSTATEWRHRFRLEMTLTQGSITLAGILSGTKSYGAETITVAQRGDDDGGDPREQTIRYNRDNSWRDEIDEFATAVIEDLPVAVGSSMDALKTMHFVYRIYCADTTWRERWNLDATIPKGLI